ncbi:hypothetical protein DH2020_019871 [Rehmannia glutinosa]|uniref:Armadillo repeat-containing protein n=1 Tax=Rehmannia glutinosa TaxID=99300 RepID=A0ABR0WF01_REHGL
MQKREQSKLGGAAGGSATPAAKRGRPIGSGSNSAAASAAAAALVGATGDSAAPSTLLGPSLQVHSAFAGKFLKNPNFSLTNTLFSHLSIASGEASVSLKLRQQIDDWRDIALPRVLTKKPRVRLLGTNSAATGFGNQYETLNSGDSVPHPGAGSNKELSAQKNTTKPRPSGWWFEEDGLFNLDEEGRVEKQQCAVAASNIIRNFSFMAENEIAMGQNRHCLETMFQCLEDYVTEDEELVTNALETIMNLGPLLDLRIFSSSKEKRAVQAIMGMLGSAVRGWHCTAAELLGRMILNPDNEPFLLPFAPQIYKRLVDIMSFPAGDAQAAAVSALYNLAEVNMDCRLKLASERWAVDRLLKVIKTPHPVPEVCRKAALILENLVMEPQNKPLLLAYENAFADMLFSETRYADTFARILHELTSRPSNKVASARGIWGM